MSNESKLEIKDRNILQFLSGGVFVVFGFLELQSVSDFNITNKSVYGGAFILFLGLFVIFYLWEMRKTTFDKKTNSFTYHTWSILKGGKEVHRQLDQIEKILYCEKYRIRPNSYFGGSIKKKAIVNLKEDNQFLIYEKIGHGFINFYKQKTQKIAEKASVFLEVDLEVDTVKLTPSEFWEKLNQRHDEDDQNKLL